jgi:hypothetical protein
MRSVALLKCLFVLPFCISACDDENRNTTPKSDARAERDRSQAGPAPTLRPRRPHEEAYAACAGLERGSSCSVTLPERTLTGSCGAPPNGDGSLACLPSDQGRRELSGRELERKLDQLEREIQGT